MANRVKGLVTRLYVRGDAAQDADPSVPVTPEGTPGVNIRLEVPAAEAPLHGYFKLELDHPNYYALYSAALTAAVNRFPLSIRTDEAITPDEVAIVSYMVIDW
jgi:hypothetical protein